MPQVVSKKDHEYAGKNRAPGEKYDAEQRFIPVMIQMGWIEPPKHAEVLPRVVTTVAKLGRRARRALAQKSSA